MKLYLVRHGKTTHNERGIIQGTGIEGELSELGIAQAQAAGEVLKDVQFDHIYSSDLHRCKQTTSYIVAHHDIEPEYLKELRERSAGIFDGQHKQLYYDAIEADPASWENFKPEGGQSHVEVYEQLKPFHETFVKNHFNKNVLAVSHGALASTWLLIAQGLPMNKENFLNVHPLNCSVSKLEFDEQGNLINIEIGETTH